MPLATAPTSTCLRSTNSVSVPFVYRLRDLGVLLDSDMSMKSQVQQLICSYIVAELSVGLFSSTQPNPPND